MNKNNNSLEKNKSQSIAAKKSFSNKILLIIIVFLLFVIVALICGGGFLFWKHKKDTTTDETAVETNNQQEETEDNNESEDESKEDNGEEQDDQTDEQLSTKVELEYISADLPGDWTIKEYTQGKGPSNLDDLYEMGEFKGLTAIEIINPTGEAVYSIKGLQGIGGIAGCSKIFKFNDTDEDYVQDQNTVFNSQIIDLSKKEYVEYKILGHEVRRVSKKIYWNTSTEINVFNPACGIEDLVKEFDGLYFEMKDENGDNYNKIEIYSAEITDEVKPIELPLLDKILESLELAE